MLRRYKIVCEVIQKDDGNAHVSIKGVRSYDSVMLVIASLIEDLEEVFKIDRNRILFHFIK